MNTSNAASGELHDNLARYPLLTALRSRRSRRFGLGMKIPGGPLAYQSRYQPKPLTESEEAALVFAACGITGHALADLCYAQEGGGNIMTGLVGRTVASGDGMQTVALVNRFTSQKRSARRREEILRNAEGAQSHLNAFNRRSTQMNADAYAAKGPLKNNFRFWRERHRVSCEARGGSMSAATCDRRATKQMARCRPAPAGWGSLACWLRYSLVTDRCGCAPRSRLASKPNSLQQNRNLLLSGPLGRRQRSSASSTGCCQSRPAEILTESASICVHLRFKAFRRGLGLDRAPSALFRSSDAVQEPFAA